MPVRGYIIPVDLITSGFNCFTQYIIIVIEFGFPNAVVLARDISHMYCNIYIYIRISQPVRMFKVGQDPEPRRTRGGEPGYCTGYTYTPPHVGSKMDPAVLEKKLR